MNRETHTSSPSASLPATPAVERLLARVGGRLTRLIWLSGLGTLVAAVAGALLLAFVADWTLHLPKGVRWVHLLLLLAVPTFFVLRDLWRPLTSRPDRAGLAVLIERAHPHLKELLVSAVQLARSAHPSGDPARIASVLGQADEAAGRLPIDRVLDPRGPRLRFALGAGTAALCLLVMIGNPGAARIFFQRIAGGDTPWPQRTRLLVEIPSVGERELAPQAPADPDREIAVRVARGSDVPVVVRAVGVVPDDVVLHFAGGHELVLGASGGSTFRTLLRACQEDMDFYVTGGDDDDELPRVRLTVLQPPDVAGLAVIIESPAYSGLANRIEFDRDVEVLAGSKIAVRILPDPLAATGVARLLPDDRVVPLTRAEFPAAPESPGTADANRAKPAAPRECLGFELTAEKTLRYRIELKDDSGLTNPDPGLFGITVVEDRAPEVEILSPGRGDVDTVLTGLVALRARAEDDFGITAVTWTARAATDSSDEPAGVVNELPWKLVAQSSPGSPASASAPNAVGDADDSTRTRESSTQRGARSVAIARQTLEIAKLGGAEAVVEGQQFQLTVSATDNRAPTAHEGRSAPVRIRVVAADEFMRRLQDRLARAQASASALSELQREKNRRVLDLLAALESDALLQEGSSAEIASTVTGQRRVQGDARALARELSSLAEAVLYSRIDERATPMLEMIDQALAESEGRGFDPAPWKDLASASRSGRLGASGLASKLVDIVGLSLEISEDHATKAASDLSAAQDTVDLAAVHTGLASAADAQKLTLEKLDRLLEMLAEWDNFQSVLSLTRDILNGQKGLTERTRQYAKDQ
jgi:hypothetical protein